MGMARGKQRTYIVIEFTMKRNASLTNLCKSLWAITTIAPPGLNRKSWIQAETWFITYTTRIGLAQTQMNQLRNHAANGCTQHGPLCVACARWYFCFIVCHFLLHVHHRLHHRQLRDCLGFRDVGLSFYVHRRSLVTTSTVFNFKFDATSTFS